MQIKHDDNLFNIIFIKQTYVFNNKNTEKNYLNNIIKNSSINKKKYHIFKIKIKINITFDNLIK